MPGGPGPVYISFTHESTIWYQSVPLRLRERVDAHLRHLAHHPETAQIRIGHIYCSLIYIGESAIWGYRVDFVVDDRQSALTRMPAIAIQRAKTLKRRP